MTRTNCLMAILCVLAASCTEKVPYYCDEETPCEDPERPYCDLTGEYEDGGIRNTCVANPFDAGVIDAMDEVGTDAMPPECTQPADCDDGEFCNGAEDCVDNECVAGLPPDCADAVACTVDSCDEAADQCSNLPDHDACTNPAEPFCDAEDGCRDAPCDENTDCDDGLFCNGMETCNILGGETMGSCVPGTTPDCTDSVSCTVDTCSTGLNRCVNAPMDSLCDNGMYCDGAETCHETAGCLDQADPVCDVSCNETADRCNECVPSTSVCSGGTQTNCSADGRIAQQISCSLGCFDGTRCADIDPSNGLSSYLDQSQAGPDAVLADGSVINTTTGGVTDGDGDPVPIPTALLAAPMNGVQIRVFMVNSLSAGALTVEGMPALAIVSNGNVTIGGRLSVEPPSNLVSGPGAYDNGSCLGGAALNSGGDTSGSGGGAFGSAGGRGGNAASVSGGAGGAPSGNASLVPLRGGCMGGRNLASHPTEVRAGAGGAIQIASRTEIRFAATGEIAASGKGGRWFHVLQASSAGLGGGSGGGVLLEAPNVVLVAGSGIHANGGGGGCPGVQGSSGGFQETVAPGAVCGGNYGPGGQGAALLGNATNGGDLTGGGGGGGGGGYGRIRINNAAGAFVPPGTAVVSPAPSVGTVGTR